MQRNMIRSLHLFLWLCLCTMLLSSCTSHKTIVNALDEKEANEILVYLSSRGIEAAKVQNVGAGGGGGTKVVLWDIQVNADQASEAMALLNQAGLPRRRRQGLLDIFSSSGLVPSELQEKIKYQAGLAEQIASTIRKIDGVLDAEVQISFPEEDPLAPPGTKKGKIVASVYVKHNGVLDDPNSHLIPKIKRLVAASVAGLDYDNVTVIGDRARGPSLKSLGMTGEPEKEYVNVWSVILAKESVTRFQVLFFSFIIIILLLTLAFVWFFWKMFPLLQKYGGFKELFHVHPIPLEPKTKEEEAESKEKEGKEKSEGANPPAPPKGKVDEDIE